jgi:hypothetical protein
MTTTLRHLTQETALALADAGGGVWPAESLERWLNAAIRELSLHVPRSRSVTIAAVAGQRRYSLPADFREAIAVEFPAGADPPNYLLPWSGGQRAFWRHSGAYLTSRRGDATAAGELWLSDRPAGGESIELLYTADHAYPLQAGDPVTVPGRLHDLLILHAVAAAMRERAANAARFDEPDALATARAVAAGNAYRRAFVNALDGFAGRSATTGWSMDRFDRIY